MLVFDLASTRELRRGIPALPASAIDQRGNAQCVRALPIDFVHAVENWLAMSITASETVKIEMNIVMAIRDFVPGFFFCLNNNNICFMILV